MTVRSLLPSLALILSLLAVALLTTSPALAQTQPTPPELVYLAATAPFRARMAEYQDVLVEYQTAAAAGEIENIPVQDLGDLSRELFTARRTFQEVTPSVRLDKYDQIAKLALLRAYQASVALLQAQVTESGAERATLLLQSGALAANSGRLFKEADDELRRQLPTAVQ